MFLFLLLDLSLENEWNFRHNNLAYLIDLLYGSLNAVMLLLCFLIVSLLLLLFHVIC